MHDDRRLDMPYIVEVALIALLAFTLAIITVALGALFLEPKPVMKIIFTADSGTITTNRSK